MNARCRRFALAWLVSLSVGCTQAPIRYYTLTPPPDKIPPAAGTSLPIDVRIIHSPPQLNRTDLTVRAGLTEVTLLENERWASPVSNEIKDAVRLQIQRGMARQMGSPLVFTKLTLDIDVQRLEAELGAHALLQASWSATLSVKGEQSDAARAITCFFYSDERTHGGYDGMVEGYQKDIAALAESIVAVLRSLASRVDATCQTPIEGSVGGSGSLGH
jgi:uncharacterized protein